MLFDKLRQDVSNRADGLVAEVRMCRRTLYTEMSFGLVIVFDLGQMNDCCRFAVVALHAGILPAPRSPLAIFP
jgi:hypothetical protein